MKTASRKKKSKAVTLWKLRNAYQTFTNDFWMEYISEGPDWGMAAFFKEWGDTIRRHPFLNRSAKRTAFFIGSHSLATGSCNLTNEAIMKKFAFKSRRTVQDHIKKLSDLNLLSIEFKNNNLRTLQPQL